MGAEPTRSVSCATMRETLQRALRLPPLTDRDGLTTLVATVEGYVRQLGPELAALAPRMRGERQATALVVLRHADDVLGAPATCRDPAGRLHDLSVVARSALTLVEQPGPLDERRSAARP